MKGDSVPVRGQKNFTNQPDVLAANIPMYLCGACAKTYQITAENMIPGIKIVQLPTLAAEMMGPVTPLPFD